MKRESNLQSPENPEKSQTVKKFHQFIQVEKGPKNTAIIDLLKGNVYQVENETIDKLEQGKIEEIRDFIDSAEAEELLIDINPNRWLPENHLDHEQEEDNEEDGALEIHVDDGIDLHEIVTKMKSCTIHKVVYYGSHIPALLEGMENIKIEFREKQFQQCMALSKIEGEFNRFTHHSYLFNRRYNSCWGLKFAVDSNYKVKPCIYSEIIITDFRRTPVHKILEELKPYWQLTKDKVQICKDCELRHVCFDCREIAGRMGCHLTASNPYCGYNPYTGVWQ
jgi:radical SAM protein with 4Fe4S-binding SPASM domain